MSSVAMLSRPAYVFTAVAFAVQLVTGGLLIAGIVLLDASQLDRDLLAIELGVQTVQASWYASVVCSGTRQPVRTWTRYLDWFLTTPAMLVTLALFLESRRTTGVSTGPFLEGAYALHAALALDWLMLSLGFAYETGACGSREATVVLGGAALVGAFTAVGMQYLAPDDDVSVAVYCSTYGVWALYGLGILLDDPSHKSILFTATDLVAKNGFALFFLGYLFF